MKISVVIPVYNAVEDVKRCLDSVKENFDFSVGEVIVVDDCSDEETMDYLKRLAELNPDLFTLIRNPENKGFPGTCNNGIRHAQGEIIVLLNSDTIISACRLSRQFSSHTAAA